MLMLESNSNQSERSLHTRQHVPSNARCYRQKLCWFLY